MRYHSVGMVSPMNSPGVVFSSDLIVLRILGPAWCSSSMMMQRRRWLRISTTLFRQPTAFLGASWTPSAPRTSSRKLNGLSPTTGESSTNASRVPYLAISAFAALVFPLPLSPCSRMNRPFPLSVATSTNARRSRIAGERSS